MRLSVLLASAALLLCLEAPLLAQETQPAPTLEQRIAAGEPAAYVEMGDRFRIGDGAAVNLDAAVGWYERAAEKDDINGLYFLGATLIQRNLPEDHRRAAATLSRAVDLCESEANRSTCNSLYILRELSVAQKDMSQFKDAIASLNRALAIAAKPEAPDDAAAAMLYEDLGIIYDGMMLGPEALAAYDRAAALHAKIGTTDAFALANLELNRGNALDHLMRHEDSLAASRKALALLDRDGKSGILLTGYLHNNIGWSLMWLGRLQEAYAEYELALPIISRFQGRNGEKVAYVLNNMGIIRERQGRHREAIGLNLRSLALYARLDDVTLLPRRWALQSLSHSYAALGDRRSAILFAKMAVNTQQQIRKLNAGLEQKTATALAEKWRALYQELADLLIAEGRISEAQHVLDLLKQQELIEFVRRDADAAAASGTAALTARERNDEAEIAGAMQRPMALAAELDRLTAREAAGQLTAEERQRLDALNAELDRSYEDFVASVDAVLGAAAETQGAARDEVKSLNLQFTADRQEMLRAFPRPTVLLQAASFGDTLHLFLTTKDISVHREVKASRAGLSRMVFDALSAIEARSPGADAQLAALYGVLVKPVEQDLNDSGARVVMLNLAGFLRYVPFAALKSDRGYLIEDYALVMDTPAAQTKFAAEDRRTAAAAGFGVTGAHPGFSPLPGVARELEAIFEGSDRRGELKGAPLLDQAFTEDSFKAALRQRPKLLHVASHFRFVPGNETDSFLLLGNGDPLTLADIRKGRGYRFGGVDLLTLSACETARGSDAEGDEVESFGAIAQMNGASAVMATLWPIADEPSGQLMSDFYAGLVVDGLDKADALRRAQIAMLRGQPAASVDLETRGASEAASPGTSAPEAAPAATTRHPYYWSPYILMGNWL